MADEADNAFIQIEAVQMNALSNRRPVEGIVPNGFCHNPYCETELGDLDRLFCDGGCASEYERLKSRKRIA
jgi:hypothetical protein